MRGRLIAALLIGLAAATAAVILASGDDTGRTATAANTVAVATATIERRDLVETETEEGTLGYADERRVVNRLRGTTTWSPPAGRIVRPDRTLYKVDDSPVVLMDGPVPAYRRLGPGTTPGSDVEQLERSLRASGYDRGRAIDVDGTWDGATTIAVRRWQRAHDLEQNGNVELGRVVFLPGTRRVVAAEETRGGVVLTTTSTRRQIVVPLDAARSAVATQGELVNVELPTGEEIGGRIASVGKVAIRRAREDAAAEDAEATIDVKIRPSKAGTQLDAAPVTVRFEKSRSKDVLAVPVTALLARPGGRYAVQLVTSAGRRVVSVDPGLYAGGYVEVAGRGLRIGQRVTNAAVR